MPLWRRHSIQLSVVQTLPVLEDQDHSALTSRGQSELCSTGANTKQRCGQRKNDVEISHPLALQALAMLSSRDHEIDNAHLY
jgi:hypothetical protein